MEGKTTEPSCRFVSDSRVSWLHYYQVVLVTHVGAGRVFWCQPSLASQESSVPALPNVGLLHKFGLVTHMGRGVFLRGQPHHCICTNASRRLSATAEFLVYPRDVRRKRGFSTATCLGVCLSHAGIVSKRLNIS